MNREEYQKAQNLEEISRNDCSHLLLNYYMKHDSTTRHTKQERVVVLLKISAAVRRSFGSGRSIFLTKSFAPLDIEGQGSEVKSM